MNQLNTGAGSQYPGLPGAVCGIYEPLHHYTSTTCLQFGKIDAAQKKFDLLTPVTFVRSEITNLK